MSRQHDPRTLYGLGLRPHTIPPCPHCGGHLFLEADPQRNTSALVCLLCARTPGAEPRIAVPLDRPQRWARGGGA